jgi:pyruvate/2-oxoglutarate dehydrogenase complex dihydrolipoamide acyltransferase (E2) component
MKSKIIAPSIGDSTKSCVLSRWHKDDSCLVARGELIATLEAKKATLDIEAAFDGYLHHTIQEGVPVVFGGSIGYIEHDGLLREDEALIQMVDLSDDDLSLIDSHRGSVDRDIFTLNCIREFLGRKSH